MSNESGANGTVDLYPKKYSINNDFLIHQDEGDKKESIKVLSYIIIGAALLFLVFVCYYVCKRTPTEKSPNFNVMNKFGSSKFGKRKKRADSERSDRSSQRVNLNGGYDELVNSNLSEDVSVDESENMISLKYSG